MIPTALENHSPGQHNILPIVQRTHINRRMEIGIVIRENTKNQETSMIPMSFDIAPRRVTVVDAAP